MSAQPRQPLYQSVLFPNCIEKIQSQCRQCGTEVSKNCNLYFPVILLHFTANAMVRENFPSIRKYHYLKVSVSRRSQKNLQAIAFY